MKFLFLCLGVLSCLFIFVPQTNAATNGSLIKSTLDSSVYYLIDGKRYAFPNENIFFSWYSNFSGVVTVSTIELASYQLSGNVTYRPGRTLVKIQTDPKVYAVSRYGMLRWVSSEEAATTLYGTNWNKQVHDIPDTFFLNYQIGLPIANTQDYSVQTELAAAILIAQNIPGVSLPPTSDPYPGSLLSPHSSMEQKAFQFINAHRQSKGLATLTWNEAVWSESYKHSQNMAGGTVAFGHDGFSARINTIRASMSVSNAAENVAYNGGYDDPATIAVEGWLKSSGHLANIENGTYIKSGMGVAKSESGDYYFTQIFVKE